MRICWVAPFKWMQAFLGNPRLFHAEKIASLSESTRGEFYSFAVPVSALALMFFGRKMHPTNNKGDFPSNDVGHLTNQPWFYGGFSKQYLPVNVCVHAENDHFPIRYIWPWATLHIETLTWSCGHVKMIRTIARSCRNRSPILFTDISTRKFTCTICMKNIHTCIHMLFVY